MMRCRLCLEKKKLCKSHIIPEFFYKPLYDDKHRFHALSTSDDPIKPIEQKGIREYLLCNECENRLNKYETYSKQVLFGGIELPRLVNDQNGFETCVDYKKFKLFQLSILWRTGISTKEAFENVQLGCHENNLRQMIWDENPGNHQTYGCVILFSSESQNITSDLIHTMGQVEIEGIPCVRFLFGGLFWLFFLAEELPNPGQKELVLQENGCLRILKTNLVFGEYIERLLTDFARNRKI